MVLFSLPLVTHEFLHKSYESIYLRPIAAGPGRRDLPTAPCPHSNGFFFIDDLYVNKLNKIQLSIAPICCFFVIFSFFCFHLLN